MTNTSEKNLPNPSEQILNEIHATFGMVPNLFQAYAKHPPLLEANWYKVKAVLLSGSLCRKTKEVMAFLVSIDNGCSYCVAAHSASLQSLGVKKTQRDALLLGHYPTELQKTDIALIKFARKVNQQWQAITDNDLKALQELGINETAIIETIGVVELFAGFNRYARTLNIRVDFW